MENCGPIELFHSYEAGIIGRDNDKDVFELLRAFVFFVYLINKKKTNGL